MAAGSGMDRGDVYFRSNGLSSPDSPISTTSFRVQLANKARYCLFPKTASLQHQPLMKVYFKSNNPRIAAADQPKLGAVNPSPVRGLYVSYKGLSVNIPLPFRNTLVSICDASFSFL